MTTLSLRTLVRNAAAVFSGCYGEVTRRAEQAGCSRQAVYDHARRVERRRRNRIGLITARAIRAATGSNSGT